MVYITEELVRRRAEHNDCEIHSLEELSLHQLDIEKIQHLDRWCRELRILLLQNNLIAKIENVGRLKKLEYLNLALNNIEEIENLEGCESLQKLDLTLNFVGRVSNVASLKQNVHLRVLYLMGNPCDQFQGYRPYVVTALPQLQVLDCKEVTRSERLLAAQGQDQLKAQIHKEEQEYLQRRAREKEVRCQQSGTGFDGRWYTDINSTPCEGEARRSESESDFWNTPCSHSPEARQALHKHMEQLRIAKEKPKTKDKEKMPLTLITAEGRVLNINQARLDFSLIEDEENNTVVVDLAVYRHLDTSLIEVDIQPHYIRITVKGKVFQLVLPAEVQTDTSTAKRSQTTGHLLLTMPRVSGQVQVRSNRAPYYKHQREPEVKAQKSAAQKLEVCPQRFGEHSRGLVDLANIVESPHCSLGPLDRSRAFHSEPSVSPDFVDDPDVPPLI